MTAKAHQQQPTRATLNALRLLSHSKRQQQAGCQRTQTIQPIKTMHKRYETHNRWEELVGFSLAVVGIAVVWGFALGTLADQPIQHSGTQVHKVVAR